jgi:hypothetical protein
MRRQIRIAVVLFALCALAGAARALTPPQRALLLGAGAANGGGGSGGCSGIISTAAGCPLPMLGM